MRRFFMLISGCAFIFAACSKTETNTVSDFTSYPISFEVGAPDFGSDDDSTDTKITDTQSGTPVKHTFKWEKGDQISIVAYKTPEAEESPYTNVVKTTFTASSVSSNGITSEFFNFLY